MQDSFGNNSVFSPGRESSRHAWCCIQRMTGGGLSLQGRLGQGDEGAAGRLLCRPLGPRHASRRNVGGVWGDALVPLPLRRGRSQGSLHPLRHDLTQVLVFAGMKVCRLRGWPGDCGEQLPTAAAPSLCFCGMPVWH